MITLTMLVAISNFHVSRDIPLEHDAKKGFAT